MDCLLIHYCCGTMHKGAVGGVGRYDAGNGGDGDPNTGGGGGGSGYGNASPYIGDSGAGGSGIVIVRYADSFSDLSSIGAGLTSAKTTAGGYTIYKFTAGTGDIIF